MALRLPPPQRIPGDGMEKTDDDPPVEHNVVLTPNETHNLKEQNDSSYHDHTTGIRKLSGSLPPSKNLGSAIKLTPQPICKKKKDVLVNLKNKEPKFVPYEPYKAAVKPIVPVDKKCAFIHGKKNAKKIAAVFNSKNKSSADDKNPDIEKENDNIKADAIDWELKTKSLQLEIQTLKEENEQLENQLKYQVQVNGELKNLLVAAIGEDMGAKVNVLTEDKLHLARALLNSAKSLTTHQEQMEWLAGQCEVWRSKFLASSVMVEELARWKASLCQKVSDSREMMKKLLEDRKEVREHLKKSHENLSVLKSNFDLVNKRCELSSANVIDLSANIRELSEVLIIQLLGSENLPTGNLECYDRLPNQTAAEKAAENLIAMPHMMQLIGEPDMACNAVVGAAVALSGQLYLQSHPPKIECCPQCSGEIKLV